MKRFLMSFISLCLAAAVAFSVMGISAFAETVPPVPEEGVFCVQSASGVPVNGFYNEKDGKYYIFITANTNKADVDLTYCSSEIDGGSYKQKTIDNAFAQNDEITVSDAVCGAAQVKIMLSQIPSMYIDLEGTSLEQIHNDKTVKYPGNSVYVEDKNSENNLFAQNVEIKGRGNSSWKEYEKKGYQIKFNSKTSLFGHPEAKKWCLIPSTSDDTLMKNYLAFYLAEKLGMETAIECNFVDLWIEGDYRGLYLLTEKSEIGKNRVNLTDDEGLLCEWDQIFWNEEDYNFYSDSIGAHFAVKESVSEEDETIKSAIQKFKTSLDDFWAFMNGDTADATLEELGRYIDVDSFAKYYLLNEYLLNKESVITSFFWYKDGEGDVLHLGPVWDFDTSITSYGDTSYNTYHDINCVVFYELAAMPCFRDLVMKLYYQNASLFDSLTDLTENTAKEIRASADMNYIRWDYLGKAMFRGSYHKTYDIAIDKAVAWLAGRKANFAPFATLLPDVYVNDDAGTVKITYFSNSSNSSVRFAVWSNQNGMDDIRWADAVRTGSTYCATLSLSSFADSGEFTVHVYENSACACGRNFSVKNKTYKSDITAQVSQNNSYISVSVTAYGDFDKLYLPTWSEQNGQDDIVWHEANKIGDNKWQCDIGLSSHRSVGNYIIHCYGSKGGQMIYLNKTDVTVKKLGKTPSVTATFSEGGDTVYLTLLNGDIYERVYFPVWSTQGGQNDIVWYGAERQGSNFVSRINYAPHADGSDLIIHCYGDRSGARSFITYITKPAPAETRISFTVMPKNNNGVLEATVTGGGFYDTLYFPTWSEQNGQDDIVWFGSDRTAGGWKSDINLERYASKGNIIVHCYGSKGGVMTFLGARTAELDPINVITYENSVNGNVTVTVLGAAQYNDLRFPAWTENNGQDDLIWHSGAKNSSGVWVCEFARASHIDGNVKVDIYGVKDGALKYLSGTVIDSPAPVFLATSVRDDGSIKATVLNGAYFDTVYFPTWNEQNGQDDIIWHGAAKNSGGIWSASIKAAEHKGSENISVHAYGIKNGVYYFLGAASKPAN